MFASLQWGVGCKTVVNASNGREGTDLENIASFFAFPLATQTLALYTLTTTSACNYESKREASFLGCAQDDSRPGSARERSCKQPTAIRGLDPFPPLPQQILQ